jgi:Protein of unknown function (DUF3738)
LWGDTAEAVSAERNEKRSIRTGPQMGPEQKIQSWHVVATRFSFAQLNETFARLLDRVLITAMRDQLGLKIKSQKALVDFFVIESAKKVTAGN